jgi:hypothetical protein
MRTKSKRSTKLLAFAPALVIIGITAITASGLSVVSGATASTVNIDGSVSGNVSTNADPDTLGPSETNCTDETLGSSFATVDAFTSGCQLAFATNYGPGAEIIFDNNNVGDAAFFCNDPDGAAALPRACASGSLGADDGDGVLEAGEVGLQLQHVAGDGGNAAGSDVTLGAGGAAGAATIADPIASINDTDRQLCATTGPSTNSTCRFTVAGRGTGATQASGDYTGTIRFTTQSL